MRMSLAALGRGCFHGPINAAVHCGHATMCLCISFSQPTAPAPPLPCPADKVTLRRQPWTVPASYAFGDSEVVPMWAGQECPWTVVEQ